MNYLWIFGFVIETCVIQTCLGAISDYARNETALKASLLNPATYDIRVRPEEKMTIQIRFNILAINDLNIKGQQLSTAGWLTLKWTDTRLQWSPVGNPLYFFDTNLKVWVPELMVDNSVLSLGVIRDDNIIMRVRYDGEVTWEPTGIFYTSCNIDISFYPFDKQRCQLEITSWAYNINEQNLTFLGTGFNLKDYRVNGEWNLVSTSTAHSLITEQGEVFPQLDFVLTTHRRSTYYILNIILPIALTSVLSVVVFILPFECGEKVSYALTVLLSYAVLLTIVAAEMPPISNNVSILAVYLALILIVGATATFLTVVNLFIYHRDSKREVPDILKTFVINFLCKASSWRKLDKSLPKPTQNRVLPETDETAFTNYSEKNKTANHVTGSDDEKEAEFYSWMEIASMFDAFYFRLFTAFVLIITLLFFTYLPIGGSLSV